MNMKPILNIFLIASLILCPVRFAFSGEAGSATASFLKFTPGPRATGMGEAYTSITADAYSAYWNPAGLANLEVAEIAATYNKSFEDVNHQYVSIAFPLKYGSVLDLNITRLSIAEFQGYDAQGTKTKLLESSDFAVGAAYARTLMKDEIERPVLNVGVNLKSVSSSLDDVSATALAIDLGAIYHIRSSYYWMKNMPAQEWRIGFAARNIGTKMKFDEVSFPLPMSFTLGASWQGHPGANSGLIFSFDQTFSNDDKYIIALGSEFSAFQLLALRAGYKSGQDEGSGLRVGFGFKLSFADFDYSMSPFGDLGGMHKLGVSVKFGRAKSAQPLTGEISRVKGAKLVAKKDRIEKLDKYAGDFINLAVANLNLRQYVSAIKNMDNAFNLNPSLRDGEWGSKRERLSAISKKLRLKDMPERSRLLSLKGEQAGIAGDAIISYMNENELKAFLLAHAAFGTKVKSDAVFEELLNALSDLTGKEIRRSEILPKVALIKEKLRRAASYFYARQFDRTAIECEEVVLLDKDNALAWTRLGSSYYVIGDLDKSRKAYLKALELNPGDEVTRKFIKIQGWE